MERNLVLWLEDQADTVIDQIGFCESSNLSVLPISGAERFIQELEDNAGRICLIIIDVMLHGIDVILKQDTDDGYNAGWVMIEQVLRPSSGPNEYSRIPLLVLTALPLELFRQEETPPRDSPESRLRNIERICARKAGYGPLECLQKGDGPWVKRFEDQVRAAQRYWRKEAR